MRTIPALLTTAQKTLSGKPVRSLVIGSYDATAYLLEYDYREAPLSSAPITLHLNNASGIFNTLPFALGAVVELRRGLGASLAELPRFWVEEVTYTYTEAGEAHCVIECLDWWGKLEKAELQTAQSWTATSATTILEWILAQVGLTRKSGTMTALTLDSFTINTGENLASALRRLMDKLPEYLYPGIDDEICWKQLDPAEASAYTFGWNAQHPILNAEAGYTPWEINSVTVTGQGTATGSASDATQIAAVGRRHQTFTDTDLTTNAQCAQEAAALLSFYAAQNVSGVIKARPVHGLELYDVVTLDNPPWQGSDVTGRVVNFRESYSSGIWQQVIRLGAAPDKDPATSTTPRPGTGGGSSKPPTWWQQLLTRFIAYAARKYVVIERRLHWLEVKVRYLLTLTRSGTSVSVPVGGIIAWSGAAAAIPTGWHLCDGDSGTPDLRDRFIIGAGNSYYPNDTGGAITHDFSHTHAQGTLAVANHADHTHAKGTLAVASHAAHTHAQGTLAVASHADHTHAVGTLATDNDTHSHAEGTLITASDGAHTHGAGTLATDTAGQHTHNSQAGGDYTINYGLDGETAPAGDHSHDVTGDTGSNGAHDHGVSGDTANDTHSHALSGNTANPSATLAHTVSGVTANPSATLSHSVSGVTANPSATLTHTVSGSTASGGDSAQATMPPYYALCWIMRIV